MKRVILLLITLTSFAASAEELKVYNHKLLQVVGNDMTIGSPRAKVTMIEYSSLTCPHCAHFHTDTYKKIKRKYINKGLVRYVYRDFPINQPALDAAVLAHCSGKGRYLSFLDTLFESQNIWAFHHNYKDSLANIAKLGGIPDGEYKKCKKDKELENFILNRTMKASEELDIQSTPTFFINGEKVTGAKTFKMFASIIDKKLASLR